MCVHPDRADRATPAGSAGRAIAVTGAEGPTGALVPPIES